MASFRFCGKNLIHIKLFVVNKSAISPFLGGAGERERDRERERERERENERERKREKK